MPVIGRLDDQVDRVLIKPLERGREDGDEPAPLRAPEPPPATEESKDEAREGETSPAPGELPVWLL